MRFVYLHGFASSPRSRKAVAFQQALSSRGIHLEIPVLDRGDFRHLTISGQLAVVQNLIHGEPACLAGSSMGGYLAALYAALHPETARLVLMAPAFSFASRWESLLGADGLQRWRTTGATEVFHYGDQCPREVSFDLYSDSLRHPPFPDFTQPALIFHGLRDEIVPIGLSRQFVLGHPNAVLRELDSDHELLSALDQILTGSADFLT